MVICPIWPHLNQNFTFQNIISCFSPQILSVNSKRKTRYTLWMIIVSHVYCLPAFSQYMLTCVTKTWLCQRVLFQALLFNICKQFTLVSQTTISVETLMVDCFVSSFRINYRNSQPFDDCLLPTAPVIFSVVYVKGLCTIVRQVCIASCDLTCELLMVVSLI